MFRYSKCIAYRKSRLCGPPHEIHGCCAQNSPGRGGGMVEMIKNRKWRCYSYLSLMQKDTNCCNISSFIGLNWIWGVFFFFGITHLNAHQWPINEWMNEWITELRKTSIVLIRTRIIQRNQEIGLNTVWKVLNQLGLKIGLDPGLFSKESQLECLVICVTWSMHRHLMASESFVDVWDFLVFPK